ncbi:MAG TPA: hypothetical protein VFK82_02815 [Burkholderiaceae bacterium]|nr:hypothetical protein [Burkholderiaceae bacterium]
MVINNLKNALRRAFRLYVQRRQLPVTPNPGRGVKLINRDYRMVLHIPVKDEMWEWLLEKGWRESTFRPDRRHYRDVPMQATVEFLMAERKQRRKAYVRALEAANKLSQTETTGSGRVSPRSLPLDDLFTPASLKGIQVEHERTQPLERDLRQF